MSFENLALQNCSPVTCDDHSIPVVQLCDASCHLIGGEKELRALQDAAKSTSDTQSCDKDPCRPPAKTSH
eukprot:433050-Amphidinium_carterae.1